MKKAIVLLLALTVIGGAVFAQDDAPAIKLSGAIYGGLVYDSPNAVDPAATMLWNRNDGSYGYDNAFRVRLNAVYAAEAMGVKVRLQSDDFTAPVIKQGYGWASFFDGMAKFKAGKLDDYTWATAENTFGHYDGSVGTQLIVAPIDGLSFGLFVPTEVAGTDYSNVLEDIDFGAAYSLEGIGAFSAGYLRSNKTKSDSIYFGANVTAIEGLTADVEVKLSNMGMETVTVKDGELEYYGATYIYEKFGYQINEPLYVGIEMEQELPGITDANFAAAFLGTSAKTYLTFAPVVEYALEPVTLGFTASYKMNIMFVEKTTAIALRPYGIIPLSNGELELGAIYTMPRVDGKKVQDAGKDKADPYRLYAGWTFNF